MNTRLVHLVRHAPPRERGRMLGHGDDPAQVPDCPQLRARVAGLSITRIVSSDLARAAVQARALAKDLGLAHQSDPRWRELDFGAWDGLEPGAVDPAALAAFWHDPEAAPPPGGERWSQICARVGEALELLGDGTLVIAHAGAMRAALAVLAGLDHRGAWALHLPYRARMSLRMWEGERLSGQVVGLATGDTL